MTGFLLAEKSPTYRPNKFFLRIRDFVSSKQKKKKKKRVFL